MVLAGPPRERVAIRKSLGPVGAQNGQCTERPRTPKPSASKEWEIALDPSIHPEGRCAEG